MKAFLMYRDRDLDLQQLLSEREKQARLRRSDQKLPLEELLPWNAQALRQDLGLDVIFRDMAHGDAFLFEVAQVGILTSVSDLETINYRQGILNDCARNESIVRGIYQLAVDRSNEKERSTGDFLAARPV